MIVLDTNVLSELMKRKGSKVVRNWATQQPVMSLFTTTITQAEILYSRCPNCGNLLHLSSNHRHSQCF